MSKASKARARQHKKAKGNTAPVPPIRKQAALVMLKTGTGKGRPREEGDRYPGGRLKPPKPNARVTAHREALMGSSTDLASADDPLDFALAKGWITERLHKAGRSFQRAYEQSRIGAPGLDRGGPVELDEAMQVSRGSWSEMPDAEVAAVFDRVFSTPPASAREERERRALERWKAVNTVLETQERTEMFLVCVQASWPFWMLNEAAGKTLGYINALKRTALLSGLRKVAAALRPRRQATGQRPKPVTTFHALPPVEPLANVTAPAYEPRVLRTERTHYVDPEGAPVLEVVRIRKSGAR